MAHPQKDATLKEIEIFMYCFESISKACCSSEKCKAWNSVYFASICLREMDVFVFFNQIHFLWKDIQNTNMSACFQRELGGQKTEREEEY